MTSETVPMWHEDFVVTKDTPSAFWCPACGHYHPPEFKSWYPAGRGYDPGSYYCTWCIQEENDS